MLLRYSGKNDLSSKKIVYLGKMFGKNIRAIRKSLGLNQVEFAKPLEISGKYISDLERGRAIPSHRILQLIEINYRINRKWLETGRGEKFVIQKTNVSESDSNYNKHGGYRGHTTDELTGDTKMSEAVARIVQIYDAGDHKIIKIVSC